MNEHYAPEGEVNLRAVIEDSVQAVSSYAKSEKVKIVNNFNKDAWVKGDADQLQQIVTNILDNAIKYSGDHPVVTFDTREHNPRFPKKIGVSISDNGPGIEAANIPRLTERFYRVSKTESRNKGGTGLGLAIVKHMILRHQGELQIESKLGEGSVFTIWLPVLENINNNK